MIIVSARKNFNDPEVIVDGVHYVKEILLTNGREVRNISHDILKDEVKGKKIVILVHGYNNEQLEVYDAYQVIEEQLNKQMPNVYDHIIGYSWPGGDFVLDWIPAKSRANAVARLFRILLEDLQESVQSIDIISHSLGARVVLKALKESKKVDIVSNHYCMAAAVDNECLEVNEEFFNAMPSCKRLFVFHSARDNVLKISYTVAEMDRALGLNGPEDKDYISRKAKNIYVANCKKQIDHHGGYKRSEIVYKYMHNYLDKDPEKFKTL